MLQVKIVIGESAYVIEGKINTELKDRKDKYVVDIKYTVVVIEDPNRPQYASSATALKYQHSAMIIFDDVPPAKTAM